MFRRILTAVLIAVALASASPACPVCSRMWPSPVRRELIADVSQTTVPSCSRHLPRQPATTTAAEQESLHDPPHSYRFSVRRCSDRGFGVHPRFAGEHSPCLRNGRQLLTQQRDDKTPDSSLYRVDGAVDRNDTTAECPEAE